jgi:hypothetical protein
MYINWERKFTMKKIVLVLAFVLSTIACGPMKFALQGTTLATGADATLTADVSSETSVTKVNFIAENLPPAGRVKEGSTTFVVWQRKSAEVPWTRVGALVYNESGRTGEMLDTTIPETAFDFQVTVEQAPDVAAPSPEVIFSQHVQKS